MSKIPLVTAGLLVTAVFAAAALAGGNPTVGKMGPTSRITRVDFRGYYDGHKDTYLSTDVSSKTEATAMNINYAATLKKVPLASTPPMYLVVGKSAPNQLAVFGSEPGEADYSPIWQEVLVRWKSGIKPVLLVKDDQVTELAKKGKLTVQTSGVRLNCPIIKVGHGGT